MGILAIPLGALLAACTTSDKGGETTSGDNGTFVPPPSTETGTTTYDTAGNAPLDVAAIGWEFYGSWDEANGLLENFLNPDGSGGYVAASPAVHVILANADYFASGGYADTNNYCDFYAVFHATASSQVVGTEFDWNAGKGGTGTDLTTFGQGFEGTLEIDPTSYSDTCFNLSEYLFPGGDPTETMDGMHFGVAFGPLSSYLDDLIFGTTTPSTTTTAALTPDNFLTEYIAVNHSDGAGGFTFPAYDWDYAYYVQTDYSVCASGYYYPPYTATTFDICGLVGVDENNYLIPGDTSVHPLHGYVQANAYWFEDIPNLDLTILKDGT